MGVDSTNTASGRGRNSVRISSKATYNHGLIILDLAHMPASTCGTWPAFWMVGPNWPNSGEVDIIEGVNSQSENAMSIHTNSGCEIKNTGNFAGTLKYSDCDTYSSSQPSNTGCSISSNNGNSYGTGFNSAGGGVYATEWTSEAISIWYFPRSAIPSDITNGAPDPSNWGLPQGQFTGACDIDEHIVNQQIVFDITFCGSWAGQVFGQDSVCSAKASTCQDYVQNNPDAFKDTYWSINSLKVYQNNGGAAPSSSSTTVATSTTTSAPLTTSTTFQTVTTTPAFETTTTTTAQIFTTTPFYTTPSFTTPSYTTPPAYTTPAYTPPSTTAAAVPSSTDAGSGGWPSWQSHGGSWPTWGSNGGNPGNWGGHGGPPRLMRRALATAMAAQ